MQARQITKIAREINKLTLKVIKDRNIGSTQIDMTILKYRNALICGFIPCGIIFPYIYRC